MLQAIVRQIHYDQSIEAALDKLEALLQGDYALSKRAIGLFLLQGDAEVERQVRGQEADRFDTIKAVVAETQTGYSQPLRYVIALMRQQEAQSILAGALTWAGERRRGVAERLSRLMMNPITGWPIALLTLFVGLYLFVGVFGAGIAVGFLENHVFLNHINPTVNNFFYDVTPGTVADLFAGEYGIITLGLRYAFAIILPIVGTFFLVFSVIEDAGYLPRLALLVDRMFKGIGLNGRAVIPLVLGFGCDTMATVVTRTQETRRERVLTTMLLALAIPCSAQLGVILALLSGSPAALGIWAGVVALVFLLVGYLASKVIPGEKPSFYMEVPPLRLPRPSNVLVKTYSRMQWYFGEVVPIFILASILIWVGHITGLFNLIISGLGPVVGTLGLPHETASAFLFGFFRRDFGAAGLYDLNTAGLLGGTSLVVAAVTLTLFVPCIAQFSVMIKERGAKTALAIVLFIFPFAFVVGYLLHLILSGLGVTL
jgi:ferrous iron transport protein B